MIQAKCIQKFRDKNGKIYGYRLKDINGQTHDIVPKDLKNAILNNQISVSNLTLTTNSRLVDKKQDKSIDLVDFLCNETNFSDIWIDVVERTDNRILLTTIDCNNTVDMCIDKVHKTLSINILNESGYCIACIECKDLHKKTINKAYDILDSYETQNTTSINHRVIEICNGVVSN